MSRCEHGEIISIYCLSDSCTWRQAGGCQNCYKRYHSHSTNSPTITQEKLDELYKKMLIRPDPKVKSRVLQEAVYNYFVMMRSQISSSIEAVSRTITSKLNYPYLCQQGQLDVFNKIKNKQYKKINRKELKNFTEFADQLSKEAFEQQERVIYKSEVERVLHEVEQINKAFQSYSQAVRDLDPSFLKQNSFVQKITQIGKSVCLDQGLNKAMIADSDSTSKGKFQNLEPAEQTKKGISSTNRDRKNSFQLNHGICYQSSDQKSAQKTERKRKLLHVQIPRRSKIDQIKVSLNSEKDQASKEKSQFQDRIKQDSQQKTQARPFSSVDRRQLRPTPQAERQNSDYGASSSKFNQSGDKIQNNFLPRQASRPKLYENSNDVRQKKITIPVKIQQKSSECESPLLRKKRNLDQSQGNKPFTLFRVQSRRDEEQGGSSQLEQPLQTKNQEQTLLKQKQTESLALLISSLSTSAQSAIPLLQAALKYAHNNLSAAEYLSYLYLEIGKPRQCLSVCNQMLEQLEDSSQSQQLAEHLNNNKAAALNLLGRYSQSINLLQRCIQKNAKDVCYKNLADAYYSIGIYEKAILNYQKALKMNAAMDEAWFNLAVCHYTQGHYGEAKSDLSRALELSGGNQQYMQLKKQLEILAAAS